MAPRPRSLPALGLVLLVVAPLLVASEAAAADACAAPGARAALPDLDDCLATPDRGSCARLEMWGSLVHANVDPSCVGLVLPAIPGMRASCVEREMHPEDGTPACCADACCDGQPCCQPPEPCCGEPEPCCREPACCTTPECCRGNTHCLLAVMVGRVRERVGAEAAGHGVCVDVGQHDNGSVYANADPAQPCTKPPSQERVTILP